MEYCPNCRMPARLGAKFCTTCGYRFQGEDEALSWTDSHTANEELKTWGGSEPVVMESDPDAGWPAAPASEQTEAGRDQTPTTAPSNESEPETARETDYAGYWPESTSDAWPAQLTHSNAPDREEQPEETHVGHHQEQAVESSAGQHQARGQAHDLLDQLRAVIDAIEASDSYDLSGVISDLEVAVTPPGALPPDDVAELREALIAARERPRDIDTIVDLTKRIDALVALVIAYDRTIAAIERSLDALRRAEQPGETVGPAPGLTGEELW